MPSTAALFRFARPMQLRVRSSYFTSQFQSSLSRSGVRTGRRFQSTDASTTDTVSKSWFSKMWNSPVGLKTVHFWAPVMKWAIVLAGVSDFYRPAEKLSLTQNIALTATGLIWTRWCLIIKPKNYLLAAVNFFLGCVGVIQVGRILTYQNSLKGSANRKEDALGVSKDLKKDTEGTNRP